MSKRKIEEEAGTSDSKKLCTENSPTAPDQLSRFESMPEEVLDNIFKYIPSKDVLNMALVSKRFDCYVGNSKIVMSRFKVTFNVNVLRNSDPTASIGQRNYDTVVIPKILVKDLAFAARLLRKFGSTVKTIELQEKYSIHMLTTVLGICNNIESFKCTNYVKPTDIKIGSILRLSRADSYSADEIEASKLAAAKKLLEDPEPLQLDNLKCLQTSLVGPALSLFGKSPLVKVILNRYNWLWTHYDILEYKKFFEQQIGLVDLEIGDNFIMSMLFREDFMIKMNFKLKILKLPGYTYSIQQREMQKIIEFVQLHEDSLEELYGANQTLINSLAGFNSLSSLELILFSDFDKFTCPVMPQVRKLEIRYPGNGLYYEETVNKFPNVNELTIAIDCTFLGSFDTALKVINGYRSFEKLTLKSIYQSHPVPTQGSIIHTRHMKLITVLFSEALPFDLDESSLEILEIKHCNNLQWLINFLQRPTTKLKLLKLEHMHLTNTYREVIEANRHKIGKLVMKHVKFIAAAS